MLGAGVERVLTYCVSRVFLQDAIDGVLFCDAAMSKRPIARSIDHCIETASKLMNAIFPSCPLCDEADLQKMRF
jgi:hypothetical protein